jgi:hypothetical protein
MDANELIDALGGNRMVAKLAGVRPSAVSNWRRFGAIPPRLFILFRDACRERGIEMPEEIFKVVSSRRCEAA